MANPETPIQIVRDFVERNRDEDPHKLDTIAETNAITAAQTHAELAEKTVIEEACGDVYADTGNKHVPGQLGRKLTAISNTMIRAAGGGVDTGLFLREHIFDLGEDESKGAYLNATGAVDDFGTTMWQEMGVAIIEKDLILPVGYIRDVQHPTYLKLNRYATSDPAFRGALDIPIRGDHIEMNPVTGRIESFKDGLHERAQVALSVLDLIKVNEEAIEATPHHWGDLDVVR